MPFRPALPLLLLLCALPAVADVEIAVEPTADFAAYRTYTWLEGNPPVYPELRAYLVRKIDEHLGAAGLRKVPSGGDLSIALATDGETGGRMTGAYIYIAQWDVGVITDSARVYTTGTLFVDLIDPATKRAVWQSRATETIYDGNFEKVIKRIDKITARMFRNFPPK